MTDEQATKVLSSALKDVFGEGVKTKKFVNVSRIPLICKNIDAIQESLQGVNTYIEGDKKWKVDDANWKREFDIYKTQIMSPLVKKESDSKVINSFILRIFKYAGTVVIFLTGLIAIWNWFIPLLKK